MASKSVLIKLAKHYFDVFSSKDLIALEDMFSKNVSLRDWNVQTTGKKNVLKVVADIFTSVKSIKVKPQRTYSDGSSVVAELAIIIDKKEKLLVVDIIDFDGKNKIKAVRAYKG